MAALEIVDVFIVDLNCRVVRDLNSQAQLPIINSQYSFQIEPAGMIQHRTVTDTQERIHIFRYFIKAGLRVLKPEASTEKPTLENTDLLSEIYATLAVDYSCPGDFDKDAEAVAAFTANAQFHAWPYWREIVHSHLSLMRLPRVTLPMMKVGQSKRK